MAAARTEFFNVEEVDLQLVSKISDYSASLFDNFAAYENAMSGDIDARFAEYQESIALTLDTLDHLADEASLRQAMHILEPVTTDFYRATDESFQKAVRDLKRCLEVLCNQHWSLTAARQPEDSAWIWHWSNLAADAHRLLEKHWEKADELLEVVQSFLTETCRAIHLLIWSELCWLGRGSRNVLKAAILGKLKTFLKESEPKLKEEMGVLFLSMQTVAVDTWTGRI